MKSLRALQRYAGAQQLLKARPATSNVASQSRAPLQQTFRTRPVVQHKAPNSPLFRLIHTQRSTFSSPSQTLRSLRRARKSNGRRHNSSAAPEAQPLSLKDRLKKMSREYGWTAVGVYLALSALDFPFCFMAVRLIGTEKIGHYEHVVVESVKGFLKWPIQGSQMETLLEEAVDEGAGGKEVQKVEREGTRRILEEKGEQDVKVEGVFDHGYRDAVKANRGDNASLGTQLALAYAIHKSFIFIRVPLTAAILPKVVKTLRGWGYNIGKLPRRKGRGNGINTKGSGVNTGR